jgi:hypothetical protein
MMKCYGQSLDGNTRISLHTLTLPLSQTIRSLLQGASRDESPARLLPFFEQHVGFHYWKSIDYTHYSNSIPNGACGWYTIMQLQHRKIYGRLLDFNNSDDLAEGCELLRRSIRLNPTTSEARDSATYAVEFALQYHANSRIDYPAQHECRDSQFISFMDGLPCALFTSQDQTGKLQMTDTPSDWLKLTIASCIPSTSEHLSLDQALHLATDSSFAILSGHHYWVFPPLPLETLQVDSSLIYLSHMLWDICMGLSCPSILPHRHPSSHSYPATASSSTSKGHSYAVSKRTSHTIGLSTSSPAYFTSVPVSSARLYHSHIA